MFFEAREAAIATLDAVEAYIRKQNKQPLSLKNPVPGQLIDKDLKSAARQYLNFTSVDEDAQTFCRECVRDEPASILRALVSRDRHVLRLVGDEVKPGPAFRGSQLSAEQADPNNENQDTPPAGSIPLPEGISYRVRNLYLLNLDMHGELDGWLNPVQTGSET